MSRRLLLASHSPRRRELLQEAGFEFEVIASLVSEIEGVEFSLRELTIVNALRKARGIAKAFPDAVVLGADTLVACHGKIIGKPRDLHEARKFLQRLSARTHDVCTGVCIASAGAAPFCFAEFSRVKFKPLSDRAISHYFSKINPLDKAGAYAAQGEGRRIIEKIDGSVSNVVGLPLESTTAALARFGLHPRR